MIWTPRLLRWRDRHLRGIPLTQGQLVVGIVALDDLIVTGRTAMNDLAEIVRVQLPEPALRKRRGEVQPGAISTPVA